MTPQESDETLFTPLDSNNSKSSVIRVAVVDDSTEVSVSVVDVLSSAEDMEVVAVYHSGEEAIRGFAEHEADVVLMDLRLPGMNGVQCAAELKRKHPALAIMIFTAFGEDDDSLFESLRLGACGYILKRSSAYVLVDAIRDLHAGGSPMSPRIARKVVKYFQQTNGILPQAAAKQEQADDDVESLSVREREVLGMLSEGLRYKEIADQLFLSVATVRSHLRRIYDKLQVTSRTEAVVKYLKASV
jgi:DNA-binding NarL/FixJ family response regulator